MSFQRRRLLRTLVPAVSRARGGAATATRDLREVGFATVVRHLVALREAEEEAASSERDCRRESDDEKEANERVVCAHGGRVLARRGSYRIAFTARRR